MSATAAPPGYRARREAMHGWLSDALAVVLEELDAIGIRGPAGQRYMLGFGALPFGVTAKTSMRRGGVAELIFSMRHIFPPAGLNVRRASRDLVIAVLHECLHAFDGCDAGHDHGRWRQWAEAVGLKPVDGQYAAHAERIADQVLERLGWPPFIEWGRP